MRSVEIEVCGRKMLVRVFIHFLQNLFSKIILFLKFCLFVILLLLFGSHDTANPEFGKTTIEFFSTEFRKDIQNNLSSNITKERRYVSENDLVQKFYSIRQYMPAWTLNFATNTGYIELINLLKSANNFGLPVTDYSVAILELYEAKMKFADNDQNKCKARVELEKEATHAAFLFMIHLSTGISENDTSSKAKSLMQQLPDYLNNNLQNKSLTETLLAVQPQTKEYRLLQMALVNYLQSVTIDNQQFTVSQLQAKDSIVSLILSEQGLLDEPFKNDSLAIARAFKKFQRVHCLKQTGKADKKTMEALCMNTQDHFSRIALNLDRLRKDALKANSYILVNIPEFKLLYFDEKGQTTHFNVIVGKRFTPTPILTSMIDRIVTNPYWNVPQSIALNEIVPKAQSDSLYFVKHGYEIICEDKKAINVSDFDMNNIQEQNPNYRIRQRNGKNNALGVIKFLFPNKYNIYLHDTPSKNLFQDESRAYSHGCIRIQEPEKLAKQIIATNYKVQEQTLDIENLIRIEEQCEINLTEPVPIYIRYYTCTVDSLGEIIFHPDIYSYDKEAIRQLFAKSGW